MADMTTQNGAPEASPRVNPRRFTGGNLTMSAALLKSVPLATILEALALHEREQSRADCISQRFVTRHRSPQRTDFKVVTDCREYRTSICLEQEDPGL